MVCLLSVDAKINGRNSKQNMRMNQSGKMFQQKWSLWFTTNPSILQFALDDYFSEGWSHLILTSNSRILQALKGTRSNVLFSVCAAPGSDLAAGAMKTTALSQRRRNSHFSASPLWNPHMYEVAVMGSKKWSPDFRREPPLCWESVDFSPPVCEGAAPGFMNKSLSNKICFSLHLPSSSFFWDLILLQPSLTSDLRPLDLTHLLRWSSLRSIMAFSLLTSSS